jgi:hypothetical protein
MWSRIRRSRSWFLFLLFLFALPSPGQARIRPGLEVGGNVTTFHYDDDNGFPFTIWDRSWRRSATGGATLEWGLRPRFALATGVRFVQQGIRVRFDDHAVTLRVVGKFTVVQSYAAVPLLIRVRPLPTPRLFIATGPEFGVLLSGRMVTDYSSPNLSRTDEDIHNGLERTNVTWNAEAGVEWPMGRHLGVVTARYAHGLTRVAKKDHWVSAWETRDVEGLIGMRW